MRKWERFWPGSSDILQVSMRAPREEWDMGGRARTIQAVGACGERAPAGCRRARRQTESPLPSGPFILVDGWCVIGGIICRDAARVRHESLVTYVRCTGAAPLVFAFWISRQ
jgi:hypothetical protein